MRTAASPAYVMRLGEAMAAGRGRAFSSPRWGGAVSAGPAPEERCVTGTELTSLRAAVQTRLTASDTSSLRAAARKAAQTSGASE